MATTFEWSTFAAAAPAPAPARSITECETDTEHGPARVVFVWSRAPLGETVITGRVVGLGSAFTVAIARPTDDGRVVTLDAAGSRLSHAPHASAVVWADENEALAYLGLLFG